MQLVRWAVLGLFTTLSFAAVAAAPSPLAREALSVDAAGLRSIAGWLRAHGADGYVGADVADAMGIARAAAEDLLEARQRGFRNEQTLRIAQFLEKGQFILFMVQQPDDQVFFFLSSVRDGLKKAFVSIPSRNLVAPLDPAEAESGFRREVIYWEDKAASR